MKLARGNMFAHPAALILVTTNAYVRNDGTLVMGRGAAADMRRYLLNAERIFGEQIDTRKVRNWDKRAADIEGQSTNPGLPRYGLLFAPLTSDTRYGIFQVKYHWGRPALVELIEYSTDRLCEIAHEYEAISLNYPGIGNGGLARELVEPIIARLPDNVTVWTK